MTRSSSSAPTGATKMRRLMTAALSLVLAGTAFVTLPAAGAAVTAASAPSAFTGDSARPATQRYFSSPSGNIGCALNRRYARCDINKHTYSPPPKPASCNFDWGQSLQVHKRARFICVSDTVAISDRVLQYGDSLRLGNKKCTSRRSGMVCRNLQTEHGFRLSRDDVDRF